VKYLASFFRFWKDFIIGDDWTIAAGVVLALAVSAALVHAAIVPWLWLPVGIAATLTASLRRA
jgi:hypothetical protein